MAPNVLFLLGSLIALLIAGGCLLGCVISILRQTQRRKGSVQTTGIVVGLEKRIFNAESAGVYCPTVEFKTESGETVRFESSFGTMPASNKVGDVVKLFYDPNAPGSAEIDSSISKWLAPGCFFIFSIGSCFFSLLFMGLFLVYAGNP
jgi:hypothetical protein